MGHRHGIQASAQFSGQSLDITQNVVQGHTAANRSGGVLPLIALRVQRDLMDATVARGHAGLKLSHAQVLPLIGPDGGRIHEMARIQRVSRQAISAVSRELEAYRSRMSPEQLALSRRRGIAERLRRRLGLPRLSGSSDEG